VIEVPRKKKEAPAVQEVNPVKALVGHRIRTHYNTGGVVARVDYWGDADSYTIYYEDENAHKRLWLNDIKLQDGVILCEGKPLAIDEEEQAAQEVSMEAALDQIANGPGPTPEETAASKTKFQQDLARHRKVKEAPAADPVQALIGRRINHHGAVGAVNDVAGPRTDGLYVIYFQPDTGKSVLEYLMCALQDGVFTCDGVPLAFETDVPAQDVTNTPEDPWAWLPSIPPKESIAQEAPVQEAPDPIDAAETPEELMAAVGAVLVADHSAEAWPASCKDCTLDVSCGKCPNCPEQYEEAEPAQEIIPPVQEAPAVIPGTEVPIAAVYPNPDNPRKRFDEAEMEKLIASVKQLGVLAPILCVPDGDRYRIVDGERRYRAALAAELERVPLIVRDLTPEAEFEAMLTANIQRADLDPIEEAQAFAAATARGWKQEALAAKLGISQAQVANRLRLLKLPAEVQELISREILSPGHGLELVKIAAAPALVKKMAEEFAEQHTPIKLATGRIANEISGHHDGGRPLYIDGRHSDAPRFDFQTVCLSPYESRKGACKYVVKAKRPCWETRGDDEEDGQYCIHPECWDKWQKEAIDALRETEMTKIRAKAEAAGKNPDKIKLPDLRKMDWDSREVFRGYTKIQIVACAGCEKIIDALEDEEIVRVCTDKGCWKKKERAMDNEKIRDAKKQNQDFEATKDFEIRRVIDGRFSHDHAVYMALELLRNPASSTKWSPTKVQDAAFKEFGITFNGNMYYGEQDRQDLYDQVQRLDDARLMELIFYCTLRGLDAGSRLIYDLTLGAVAGEEALT
jgi:ParB family chromosome partitioning protein